MPALTVTPFTRLAAEFRGNIVRMWAISEQKSAAEAARILTDHARELNLISRELAVPGSALTEWNKRKQPPLWAALAAFDLEIKRGWRPVKNEEWAGFASLIIKLVPALTLESLPENLPADVDLTVASGWIVAAVEEEQHYRTRKKMMVRAE
ncbi:hypothetical protein RN053_07125 [Pantoea dispersa]|uniref:hypothetical protein n=1 Tax=Pantoea dispersa TaxID=59814 RepID=UPI0028DF41F1|nr:hypothetical protein [Pantoea dispersa]MDT8850253.1 hypothetical protein [Pantoea dispersa]